MIVGVIRIGHSPIAVNADDLGIAAFLYSRSGAQANRTSHRHDDVGAFVHQAVAQFLTLGLIIEVSRRTGPLRGR